MSIRIEHGAGLLKLIAVDGRGVKVDAMSIGDDVLAKINRDRPGVNCEADAAGAALERFWNHHAAPGDDMQPECKLLYPLPMAHATKLLESLAKLGE